MSAPLLTNYVFQMKSLDLDVINFNDTLSVRAFPKILLSDSILDFYPQAEIYVRDKQGILSEKLFMVEGLQIETKLGREKDENVVEAADKLDGYLVNQYAWINHNINQTEIKNQISGDYIFLLVPIPYIKDSPDTLAYNDTISNIVKKVITDSKAFGYQLTNSMGEKKVFIGDTTALKTVWYQAGRYTRFFLESLASRAISLSPPYANSPYYTFLNNKGEFYFMSAAEMLSQPPIAEYRIEENMNSPKDPYVVKSYTIQSGGALINKVNYKKRFHTVKSDGTVVFEDNDISNQKQTINGTFPSNKDKLLILKNKTLKISQNITSIDNFGIYDDEDSNIYKGWKNNFYKNGVLPYRMELEIFFNPKLCAGKTITLQVSKMLENEYASEFTGAWLIMTSSSYMDIEGVPIQRLLIGKSGIAIDSTHPCANFFI